MPSIADILNVDYVVQDDQMAPWRHALEPEFDLPYMRLLQRKLMKEERDGHDICPPADKIFEALRITALQDVKVVIVGQDPYHQTCRAHGLSFSVANGKPTGSLENIINEVRNCIGNVQENRYCLTPWAEQGVLLLNAVLTVRKGRADSHKHWGWECLTTRIIQAISKEQEQVVFMLWGDKAQLKIPAIDWHRHKLLLAGHPSRQAQQAKRPFSGCRHFSRANNYLVKHRKEPICWQSIR